MGEEEEEEEVVLREEWGCVTLSVFSEAAEGLLVVLEEKLLGSIPATLCRGIESRTVSA